MKYILTSFILCLLMSCASNTKVDQKSANSAEYKNTKVSEVTLDPKILRLQGEYNGCKVIWSVQGEILTYRSICKSKSDLEIVMSKLSDTLAVKLKEQKRVVSYLRITTKDLRWMETDIHQVFSTSKLWNRVVDRDDQEDVHTFAQSYLKKYLRHRYVNTPFIKAFSKLGLNLVLSDVDIRSYKESHDLMIKEALSLSGEDPNLALPRSVRVGYRLLPTSTTGSE